MAEVFGTMLDFWAQANLCKIVAPIKLVPAKAGNEGRVNPLFDTSEVFIASLEKTVSQNL